MEEARPRRFQFGLRALLLAFVPVALIALPLGYYLRHPWPPQTFAVTGTVTLDGVPLDDALISFLPLNDMRKAAAAGTTDAAGKFALQTHMGGGSFKRHHPMADEPRFDHADSTGRSQLMTGADPAGSSM